MWSSNFALQTRPTGAGEYSTHCDLYDNFILLQTQVSSGWATINRIQNIYLHNICLCIVHIISVFIIHMNIFKNNIKYKNEYIYI